MTDYSHILEPLGWAVLHSLWQGALTLLLVLALRRLAGPSRPGLACLAGTVGLIATFGAFLVTLLLAAEGLDPSPAAPIPGTLGAVAPSVLVGPGAGGTVSAGSGGLAWQAAMPWLGALWAVGFFVLSLQCMYAWARTRCYATLGLSAPEGDWTARFERLVDRAGVRTDIRLRVSALVDSPVTLGTLKPLVLVPAGFLSGFPPEQVEAILLHEIAHIRRNDFVFGLLQTAIRTTLYFNPAVRVMSRLVDEDRELACDDFAVAQSGRPLDLAKGLAALRLSLAPSPVMAANGRRSGPLMTRLKRITGQADEVRGLDRLTAAGLGLALVGAVVFAPTSVAHPHWWDRKSDTVDEEVVVPPAPPELPAMPSDIPVPAVPALPEMMFNPFDEASTAEFEARMEAWGETMEEWGEDYAEKMENAFGHDFETRMEAWGEKMEAWGEKLEAQGDKLEELQDMSDAELAELGIDRHDVDIAAEAWGLTIAESVVGGILPGVLAGEATSEIAKERSALDAEAIARVDKILRDRDGEPNGFAFGWSDEGSAAAKAAAARAEMLAERNARRAERNAERAERNAERAERNAARAAERAKRKALESHDDDSFRMTLEGDYSGEILDAAVVAEELHSMLKDDGIIPRNADGYVFKSSPKKLRVNGKVQPGTIHKRYRDYLVEQNLATDADFGIEITEHRIEFEIRDSDSNTRISMNR